MVYILHNRSFTVRHIAATGWFTLHAGIVIDTYHLAHAPNTSRCEAAWFSNLLVLITEFDKQLIKVCTNWCKKCHVWPSRTLSYEKVVKLPYKLVRAWDPVIVLVVAWVTFRGGTELTEENFFHFPFVALVSRFCLTDKWKKLSRKI